MEKFKEWMSWVLSIFFLTLCRLYEMCDTVICPSMARRCYNLTLSSQGNKLLALGLEPITSASLCLFSIEALNYMSRIRWANCRKVFLGGRESLTPKLNFLKKP